MKRELEEELRMISSGSHVPLNVFDKISDVFPEAPPAKTYHILVVLSQGEHSTNVATGDMPLANTQVTETLERRKGGSLGIQNHRYFVDSSLACG